MLKEEGLSTGLRNWSMWADLHLRNELPSVNKCLLCLLALKGSDRGGIKGGGWPREYFVTYVNWLLILPFT